jgi:hypothetical protein
MIVVVLRCFCRPRIEGDETGSARCCRRATSALCTLITITTTLAVNRAYPICCFWYNACLFPRFRLRAGVWRLAFYNKKEHFSQQIRTAYGLDYPTRETNWRETQWIKDQGVYICAQEQMVVESSYCAMQGRGVKEETLTNCLWCLPSP